MVRQLNKPTKINILGCEYSVKYCDKPSDVDIFKRKSLWGQIDYWTRTIRIYDNGRKLQDIWQSIMHEILHGISEQMRIKSIKDGDTVDQVEKDIDLLATGLTDTFFRNGGIKL